MTRRLGRLERLVRHRGTRLGSIGTVVLALFGGSGYTIVQDWRTRSEAYVQLQDNVRDLGNAVAALQHNVTCLWADKWKMPCPPAKGN